MLLCLGDAKDIQNIPEHCGNSQIGKIESSGNWSDDPDFPQESEQSIRSWCSADHWWTTFQVLHFGYLWLLIIINPYIEYHKLTKYAPIETPDLVLELIGIDWNVLDIFILVAICGVFNIMGWISQTLAKQPIHQPTWNDVDGHRD